MTFDLLFFGVGEGEFDYNIFKHAESRTNLKGSPRLFSRWNIHEFHGRSEEVSGMGLLVDRLVRRNIV